MTITVSTNNGDVVHTDADSYSYDQSGILHVMKGRDPIGIHAKGAWNFVRNGSAVKLAARTAYLEERLRVIGLTAYKNSRPPEDPSVRPCPGGMIAAYVDLEVRHALAGHTEPEYGVDCMECLRAPRLQDELAGGTAYGKPDDRGAKS